MKASLLLLTLLLGDTLMAQTVAPDSLLASERSIDRRITLHRHQMRVSGGYGLAILSQRFDNHGRAVRSRDEGLASVRHRLNLDIRYGINDFIQLNAVVGHSANAVREQTRYIFPNGLEPVVVQEVLREYSGLEDPFVGIDIRAPLKTRKFDIALSLGAFLPLFSNEPKTPEHSFVFTGDGAPGIYQYTYRYHYAPAKGITIAQLGGMFKYRTRHWAISGRVDYRHGLEDGSSFEWQHQLNSDDAFVYRQDPYTFRLPDSFTAVGALEYQLLPWVDAFVDVSGYRSFHGWTSPEEGLKIALPQQAAIMVSPGFEIIITPRLWLRERVDFSVAGRSHEAPLGFYTTVIYNFFPF